MLPRVLTPCQEAVDKASGLVTHPSGADLLLQQLDSGCGGVRVQRHVYDSGDPASCRCTGSSLHACHHKAQLIENAGLDCALLIQPQAAHALCQTVTGAVM